MWRSQQMVSYFVSADWSKSPGKRSVYVADRRERCIRKGELSGACWDLGSLLDETDNLSEDGTVLIGMGRQFADLVVPEHAPVPLVGTPPVGSDELGPRHAFARGGPDQLNAVLHPAVIEHA